jgi:hypothetical protein
MVRHGKGGASSIKTKNGRCTVMHMDECIEMHDEGGFRIGRGRRDVKIQDAGNVVDVNLMLQ